MNFKKLVNELNSLMDSIINDHQKNEKTMKSFFTQLKEEENSIQSQANHLLKQVAWVYAL